MSRPYFPGKTTLEPRPFVLCPADTPTTISCPSSWFRELRPAGLAQMVGANAFWDWRSPVPPLTCGLPQSHRNPPPGPHCLGLGALHADSAREDGDCQDCTGMRILGGLREPRGGLWPSGWVERRKWGWGWLDRGWRMDAWITDGGWWMGDGWAVGR